ncbi:MAG TPA: TIGR02996 domain-containing protein [Gemmataceae bacterium]|nr:TIGR02996 domain-containing protein [Gemmataceae bacterium]
MSEEANLLHAIVEQPEDDGVRLVYADWLEEHGRPERADFIRLQIELARLPMDDPRRLDLEERLSENGKRPPPTDRLTPPRLDARPCFVTGRQADWRRELPSLPGIIWGAFWRGFVAEAWVKNWKTLRTQAETMFASAPVERLTLEQLTTRTAVTLANWPGLARLHVLDIRGNDIGPDGVRALAESVHTSNLTALNLRSADGGPEGAAALAASPYLARLTGLDLWENYIGDQGAAALAGSPQLTNLTELVLNENQIGPEGMTSLARSRYLTRLTELYLYQNPIGDVGAEALAASEAFATLRTLRVLAADIGDAGAKALAASPHLGGLQMLDLRFNADIGPWAAERLRLRFADRVFLGNG